MVDRSRAHPLTMGPGGDAVPCCAVPSRRAGCPQRGEKKAAPKRRVGYVGSFLGCSREEFSMEKTYFIAYRAYMAGNPLCVDIWKRCVRSKNTPSAVPYVLPPGCRIPGFRGPVLYVPPPWMPGDAIGGHQKLQDAILWIASVPLY